MVFMRQVPSSSTAFDSTKLPAFRQSCAQGGSGKGKERRPTQIVIFEVRGAHCRDLTRKATAMDVGNKNRSLQTDAARLERDAKDRDGKRRAQDTERAQDAERHDRIEDALDRGLEDTFPASD